MRSNSTIHDSLEVLKALSDLVSENQGVARPLLEALNWRVPQEMHEQMLVLAQFDIHSLSDALQTSLTISPIDLKLLELPSLS